MEGLLGRKVGMTQVFAENGSVQAVTVIEAGPCVVTQFKTPERDGYSAVQLAYGEYRKINRPEAGHLKVSGAAHLRHLVELRQPDGATSDYTLGQQLTVGLFQAGDEVDVTGTSKGKGFAGVVKRHGFHGGPKTHGQSDRHRAPGSIGPGTTPGRVYKGTRMAGRMGNERCTVQRLLVVQTDGERNLLLVRGSVPGPAGRLVIIRRSARRG
jgi:large subunit ribosomal protein L3